MRHPLLWLLAEALGPERCEVFSGGLVVFTDGDAATDGLIFLLDPSTEDPPTT